MFEEVKDVAMFCRLSYSVQRFRARISLVVFCSIELAG